MTAPLDEIRTFLGDIPADEYRARRMIQACRNAACFMATQAETDAARALCWMASDCASAWLYQPVQVKMLVQAADYIGGLLNSAQKADALEGQS